MSQRTDPADFLDCAADDRLAGEDVANLPEHEQRREPRPESRARGRLVALGATLTGASLLGGLALLALAGFHALSRGGRLSDLWIALLGVVLLATHWGWVHVAEASADAIESRRNREVGVRARSWLETIEPYTRYSVTTSVGDEGAIRIARFRHRPIRTIDRTFTFVRELESDETHSADESGVEVADRAEALRRQAAIDTERERRRWQIAAEAYETALLDRDDEEQRLAARRAVSQALSEQINTNLREPPLVE